jgi:hypothetical protein
MKSRMSSKKKRNKSHRSRYLEATVAVKSFPEPRFRSVLHLAAHTPKRRNSPIGEDENKNKNKNSFYG